MKVEIREIRREDAAPYREALDAVCREGLFLAGTAAPSLKKTRAFVETSIAKDYPHFVAEDGGRIVGWCDAIPADPTTGIARMGMAVAKGFRRQGVGRRLMEAAIAKARKQGLKKIELGVYGSNRAAISLYQKAGFVVEGKRLGTRPIDCVYDDILLMGLLLAPPNIRSMPSS